MRGSSTRQSRRNFVVLVAAAALAGIAALQPAADAAPPAFGPHEFDPVQLPERSAKELLPAVSGGAVRERLAAPVVPGLPVTGATGVQTRLDGLDLRDQRTSDGGNSFTIEPPDQALCVGNGFVIEGVNNVFSIYSVGGAKLSGNQAYTPFWNNGVSAIIRHPDGTATFGPFLSDPKCYYDPALRRFFMTELELGRDPATGAFTGDSFVNIAVSKSSTPTTDASGWFLSDLNVRNDGTQGTAEHPGCPCLGDQPLIGADRYGFYITTNEFPIFEDGFNGAQLYALDKAAMANGTLKVQRIEANNPPLAEGVAYSVQPATSPSPSEWSTEANGTEYLLSALEFTGGYDNRIAAWAMTNTKSLTTAQPNVHVSNTVIRSEVYGVPPPARQKAGPTPLGDSLNERENRLDTNDDRMNQVVYSDGRLWSGVNTGLRNIASRPPHPGIAYFVVSPRTTSGGAGVAAKIDHQGYVAVAGNTVMFPSIGVTPAGKGVMVFTLTGQKYYPTAAQVHLAASGALSSAVQVVKAGTKPADGFTGYRALGFNGIERWGDYTAAVADDSGHVWTGVEYIPGTFGFPDFNANWGTYIASVAP
jgi:hypothetical protein